MQQVSVTFLGTSATAPTKERNLSAVHLNFDGNSLLFDCPEGTQRQMMAAGISYMRVQYIFLSHFHADHFLGIPGLLSTMGMHQRDYPITVFGPKGVREKLFGLLKQTTGRLPFEVRAVELKSGIALKEKNFSVQAFPLKHDLPAFGFVFLEAGKTGEFQKKKALELGIPEGPLYRKLQEGKAVKFKGKEFKPEQVMDYSKARKGKKISIVWDTLPSKSYYKFIEDSDLLIHESTFGEDLKARAKETLHSTAIEAGRAAREAGCKKLALFHYSNRYRDLSSLENEARKEFGEVVLAQDLLKIEV